MAPTRSPFGGPPRATRQPGGIPGADQIALARGNFQRMFDAGQAKVFDKFQREVHAGDYVLFHAREDLIWEVATVMPDPSPTAQIGMMQVMLVAQIPVSYPVGSKGSDVIVIGYKDPVTGEAHIAGPLGIAAPVAPTPTGDPHENGAQSPATNADVGDVGRMTLEPPDDEEHHE